MKNSTYTRQAFWTTAIWDDKVRELEIERGRCQQELRYCIEMEADAASYLATSGNILESDVNRHSHYSNRVRKWALEIRELEADISELVSKGPDPDCSCEAYFRCDHCERLRSQPF